MPAGYAGDLTRLPLAVSRIEHRPLPEGVCTPVNVHRLEYYLSNHPNRQLVSYILHGFRHGFDIGFVGTVVDTRPNNLLSARNNPDHVSEAIMKELSRGHTSGPFLSPPLSPFHCSPLGAVPKKDGTFRIILDLSSPRGLSVNEGIPKDIYSVQYTSFDEAMILVRSVGTTGFLAKIDIRHAFRLCPVRPDQWCLLGYFWQNYYFVDTRLPFGSRSSPFIFNNFADLLCWILTHVIGIPLLVHYLDDFFIVARNEVDCSKSMDCVASLFSELGVPTADDKTVGPAQRVPYLGIEVDSAAQSIRLPADKFSELLTSLKAWQSRKKCTKRELLSLIGSLSFACKVVKPGRIFLRRLIDLSTTVPKLHHHIDLNTESRADIQWWLDFLPSWNGVCLIQQDPITSVALSLYTDASGLGIGAVYGHKWFSLPWPNAGYANLHVSVQELFAIVVAVHTWSDEWVDQQILFFCDNQSITQVWAKGTSGNPMIMKLIRFLFLHIARRNINLLMQHISGKRNSHADALSRLQVARFHRLSPLANHQPTMVHSDIWSILM